MIDLTKLNTVRLLALLKKVRKCRFCTLAYDGVQTCDHPSLETIKEECSRREHVVRKGKNNGR